MPSTDQDVAPFEYSVHAPHDLRAVSVARATVRNALTVHELPELVERAELLASELLTNAIVHARGPAELRLTWTAERLRLAVWDTSPAPLEFKNPDADGGESGRGLHLLTLLSDTWSSFPLEGDPRGPAAKMVWCEIGRAPRPLWG